MLNLKEKQILKSNGRSVQKKLLDISIVIVSYNVKDFLEQTLNSILKASHNLKVEILIVDNRSSDGSPEMVKNKFPKVHLIENNVNLGFAVANNQALKKVNGRYVLLINPDTIVQEDTLTTMIEFFSENPEAGAAGCKILNADGSLQLACRRSFPTPFVAFSKIIGLSRLFPRSRWFGKYNLTYLDPDGIASVDAVSGSFIFFRREILDSVGYFDESFFMYGEDLDWCYRIKKAGWQIYYVPKTQIIHYKGETYGEIKFKVTFNNIWWWVDPLKFYTNCSENTDVD